METKDIIDNPVWYLGEFCVYCGKTAQHHHIFPGTARRKISDKHGYILPLCFEHHTGRNGIHYNRGMALFWMQTAQRHYERHKGTRRDFINEFGKSWL